jgi:hypothetical protein
VLSVLTRLLEPGQPLWTFLTHDVPRLADVFEKIHAGVTTGVRLRIEIPALVVGRFVGDEYKAERQLKDATKDSIRYVIKGVGERMLAIFDRDGEPSSDSFMMLTRFVERAAEVAEERIAQRAASPQRSSGRPGSDP